MLDSSDSGTAAASGGGTDASYAPDGTSAGTGGASGTAGAAGAGGQGQSGSAGQGGSSGATGGGSQDAASDGRSDASTPAGDASTDAPPADPCAGRLVCDDFEKGTTGMKPGAPWVIHSSKGTALVDETHAFSGTHSVKVSITDTTQDDTYRQAAIAITGAPLLPAPNNTIYGRFMIYTDRIPDKSVHWTTAHGDGPQGAMNSGLSATYNYGGMGDLMANYYRNTMPDPNDCWQTKDVMFPTNAWTCVAFEFNGANNEMRYWQDGVEVPELHVLGNQKTDMTCTVAGVDGRWLAPNAFTNISIGWESYQYDSVGAHDAWIDDVILDDAFIPCPAE